MKALVVTDSIELSRSISMFLKYIFNIECYYGIYAKFEDFPTNLFQEIDFFIFELFRLYNNSMIRAEGIFILEKMKKEGRKFLLISDDVQGERLGSKLYWDIGSSERLAEKIKAILSGKEIDYEEEIKKLKDYFKDFCADLPHGHGYRKYV